MEQEVWKDIYGYEGLYQVSNLGRFSSTYNHNHKGIVPHIIKGFTYKNGYKGVLLIKGGVAKRYYAHRVVATMFVDNPNNFNEVDHINCDPSDCRASNLRWVDHSGNMRNKNTIKKIVMSTNDETSYRVAAINPDTNTIEFVFPSIEGAARYLNAHSQDLSKAIKNGYSISNGFRWVRLKNEVYKSIVVLPKTI